MNIRETLARALRRAASQALGTPEEALPEPVVASPAAEKFGDFTSNLALLLAKQAGQVPRELAQDIVAALALPPDLLERAEVAGAGFINFHLHPNWLWQTVRTIASEPESWGRSTVGAGKRVLVEFVSANPVGPLTAAGGRQATIGDALANLLAWTGWQVSREYCVNDPPTSTQVQRFAESLEARYLQLLGEEAPLPEDGYRGEYVVELARELVGEQGDSLRALPSQQRRQACARLGLEGMITRARADLERFGVRFDTWFRESSLHQAGQVEAAVQELAARGWTYEAEGALWLRSSAFGDDKDRVLVRASGAPTYIAADAAYHRDKLERGFDKLIDVWGPDHHGYVARTKAAVQALGYEADRLDIIIHQVVRVLSGGEMVRMSKRAGELITLADVLDEVGKDAARFFFLMRSADSHLDFDLELAKREEPENPVYYVQYAHARICSILRTADERGVVPPDPGQTDLTLLVAPEELSLMRKLAHFRQEVAEAARAYEPHRLTRYAQELAGIFHVFYTNCRVLGERPALTAARLVLVEAVRATLRNTLTLLGVGAPERM